jgi:iron complex outermembrane receptor protein
MVNKIAMATVSLLSLTFATAAVAQSTEAPQQGQGEERSGAANNDIIVTATKIATNVQDVPIAITAVSAEALQDRQVTQMQDLGAIVPNATFRKSQSIYGAGVSVTLRGIGQTDTQFSGEPAVSYYIDDVYYPFLFGSNFDLLDLDHVEILRGPQGTLFGRNAISGAVNLVSKKPSFDGMSAYVDFTTGAYHRLEVRAGLNLPLSDTMAVALSMVSKKRTGYMDILDFSCEMYRRGTPQLAGKFPFLSEGTTYAAGRKPDNCVIGHTGGEDTRAARAAFRWQPAPNVELNISGDYTKSNNEPAAEKVYENDYQVLLGRVRGVDSAGTQYGPYTGAVNPALANANFTTMFDQFSIPGAPFRWDERFETGNLYTTYENHCDPFPKGTRITGNAYYNGSLFRGANGCTERVVPLESWGISGKLNVGIDDHLEVALIGGYRAMKTEFNSGWDGTPLADSIIHHRDKTWNWSGEARLTGQYSFLDFSLGVFYYKGNADEYARPQNTRLGTQQFQTVFYDPKAKAAYLNVTLRPFTAGALAGLSFNGGIRRSDDKKFVDYAALQDGSTPGSPTFTAASNSTVFVLPIANKRWDWKLGADYKLTDDILVYGSVATGYRLPGFATRVFQKGQIQQQTETALINYEVGAKVDLFDRRLRLNMAAFQISYSRLNGTYSGNEARYDPTDPAGVRIAPGIAGNNQTVIPGGPANTAFSTAFTNCRPYNAGTDGAPNGTTVGVQCVQRTWNYAVGSGSKIKGLELEATVTPIDNLVGNFSLGYTDRGSATGRPVGFPDWTASGGVQYKLDVEAIGGSITPRLDWFYISTVAWAANYPRLDDPARSYVNGRITYKNPEYDIEVALGATNLFNKKYFQQKTIFADGFGAGQNIGQPAAPREWYLSISKRF